MSTDYWNENVLYRELIFAGYRTFAPWQVCEMQLVVTTDKKEGKEIKIQQIYIFQAGACAPNGPNGPRPPNFE